MIYSNPILKTSDFKYYFSSNKTNVISIDNYPNDFWSNSSAESLAIIYNTISIKKHNIYLPKYFCGQSLKLLRGVNANIVFYDIDKNFNIDYKKINKTCKVRESDIFVVVHYFGKINKLDELLNLKSKIDFTIIEDCTHIISPYVINNWIGDFLIFSPHKHFPLPVLGLILSKKKINHAYLGFKKFDLVWLIKQFIKKLIITNSKTSWGIQWSKNKDLVNREAPNKLSVKIATKYLKDFNELKKIIRKNYFEASDILNNYSGWQIIGNYDETPYGIIVKCNTLDIAKKNFYLFNKKINLVMQWPDLPLEIKENNNYMSTVELTNKVLFFFIDHRFDNKKWIIELKRTLSLL